MSATGKQTGVESFHDLSAFQRDVLTVLANGDDYGIGIKETLEGAYGTNVNHGRLYPNLRTLQDANLVSVAEINGRTNEYSLTERGKAMVEANINFLEANLR